MKKLTQFEKFGIIAAIIIACTFFYMKRIYEPQEKEFKKTLETRNKLAQELEGTQVQPTVQVRGELEAAKKRKAELDAQLADSMVSSGSPQQITRLLSHINSRVAESDLTIVAQTPAGALEDTMLLMTWTRYQMTLNGSFHGFLHFLDLLAAMPEAIRVENLQLAKAEKNTLNITFDLLI